MWSRWRINLKAWQMRKFGDPWDELHLAEADLPAPGPGIVQIKVEASDLSFADILQCLGVYQVKLTPPFIPGMHAAGTVIAVGDDCELAVGDRVIGPTLDTFGGYAEETMLFGAQAFRVPQGVTSKIAAAMHVTYGTAWFALHHRAQLQPGEAILVLAGAGGVGSAAIQMARARGCWVIAAAGGEEKTRVCSALGADEVIDYSSEDLYGTVQELTDGRGVDVVYDPVGGEHSDAARRLLAFEGRLLIIGFASGTIPSVPANHLLVKNYSVLGVYMGGYQSEDPAVLRRCYAELHEQLLDGSIDPLISQVIGFEALPQALRRLSERRSTGRVIFDPELA
jgi:NADPH2:quinone reductase|tara:strand:- start:2261 stop:3274 length:1014 start_codon:yes stop_codon:yes gene_type:complete